MLIAKGEICGFDAREIPGEAAVVIAAPTQEQIDFAQYIETGAGAAMGGLADGTYTAQAAGKNGIFDVYVTIEDKQIVAVEATDFTQKNLYSVVRL